MNDIIGMLRVCLACGNLSATQIATIHQAITEIKKKGKLNKEDFAIIPNGFAFSYPVHTNNGTVFSSGNAQDLMEMFRNAGLVSEPERPSGYYYVRWSKVDDHWTTARFTGFCWENMSGCGSGRVPEIIGKRIPSPE